MKNVTLGLRRLLCLGLLAAPGLTCAQTWQWAAAPGPTAPGSSGVAAVALDAAGNTVVAGQFSGTLTLGATTLTSAGRSDIFVAKVGSAGQWLQAVRAGGPGDDFVSALKLDAAGNAVVGGRFGALVVGGTATFGATTLTVAGNADYSDAFVATLSPGGQWTQAVRAGGAGYDVAGPVVVDAAGNITVGGTFTGAAAFGGTTLPGDSNYAMAFVARLSTEALVTPAAVATATETFALAPNPATGTAHLTWPDATNTARPILLLDAVGREVRRQVLPARATATTLNVTGLAPGLYMVRCGASASRLQVE